VVMPSQYETQHHFYLSTSKSAKKLPIIVVLPGGASFSGRSWGPVDMLSNDFDVITVDPPGTGGTRRLEHYEFDKMIDSIEKDLSQIKRPMAFVGISYGVIYAAELATQGKLDAKAFFGFAGPVDYKTFKPDGSKIKGTPEMEAAEKSFLEKPNDGTWHHYLAEIAPLYFLPAHLKTGLTYLLNDKSEYRSYLQIFFEYAAGKIPTDLPARMAQSKIVKVLIAGDHDGLVPVESLRLQAKQIGSKFEVIKDSAHFINVEQPKQVSELLKKYLL